MLVDDPARIGEHTALGLDETLFCRQGPWRRQCWSTSIVDVGSGRLLDIVAGRGAVEPCRWLAARDEAWREQDETLGHRGRKHDPLYRSRRLLTRADEGLQDHGRAELLGLLDTGGPPTESRR